MVPGSGRYFSGQGKVKARINDNMHNHCRIMAAFHRYRPLIEQAYEEFGYSAEDMDNALIRSLDYVLATPEPAVPIALIRKEAVFQFSDPELEQLPPLQKQLLRMGPENSARIKQWVEKLRQGLLGVSPMLDQDNSIPN